MNTKSQLLKTLIREEVTRQINEVGDFPRNDFFRRAYGTVSSMQLKKFDDAIINLAETWMSDGFDIADVTDILTERMTTVLRNY